MSMVDTINTLLEDTKNDVVVIVSILERLKAKGGDEFVKGAEKCGDACRQVEWRQILGENGILGFFLDQLDPQIDISLGRQVFRVIANSIADNDENRQRLIDHPTALKTVLSLVKNEDLSMFAVATLQNLTLDNEAAQLKVIEEGGVGVLMEAIITAEDDDDSTNIQVPLRVLELLVTHDTAKEAAPPACLKPLLSELSAEITSIDDRILLLTVLTTLLTHPPLQLAILEQDHFPLLLRVFETTHSLLFDPTLDINDRQRLFSAKAPLMDIIADISWKPTFLTTYPLSSAPIAQLLTWLSTNNEPHRYDKVIAACLVFGNVTQSAEVCRELMHTYALHKTLFSVISRAVKGYEQSKEELESLPSEQVKLDTAGAGKGGIYLSLLHSAIGVLRNFAVPKSEKSVLVDTGAFNVIMAVVGMEGVGVGQVWYSAAGLARLLCVDCVENCKEITSQRTITGGEEEGTYLERLLKTYTQAEELPTKTEIARMIVSILRCLSSSSSSTQDTHPGLARPLWDMVLQDKWVVVRSEGLLGLALSANSPGGARELWHELGEKEWEVVDKLDGRDLENVGVLIVNLKNGECAELVAGDERVGGLLEKCLAGKMAGVHVQGR
ncbi:ARM repeat-containing protein [Choiromyces venosus 120613-1]|uniref:ARM repeat-containing protein n=1 Tax=Choiromyces venosus 120613-1 TaxID=1336337 RepID=A0A3N4IYG1_9PEZI|nr:ARM repeat-containing protein [Choiromyces venosus 120613-1]